MSWGQGQVNKKIIFHIIFIEYSNEACLKGQGHGEGYLKSRSYHGQI